MRRFIEKRRPKPPSLCLQMAQDGRDGRPGIIPASRMRGWRRGRGGSRRRESREKGGLPMSGGKRPWLAGRAGIDTPRERNLVGAEITPRAYACWSVFGL